MSRPYQSNFEKDQSPLSPQNASTNQAAQLSYQANVNRQKTKKWVEAKVADYGGDDWGDDYEDSYEEQPPPPAVPKVTGFRQPGQASQFDKKTYGDLPALPSQQDQGRSVTNPGLARSNSFSKDDDRRAFSTGAAGQVGPVPSHAPASNASQPSAHPALHVATQSPITNLRKQAQLPSEQRPLGRTPTMETDSPHSIAASSVYSDPLSSTSDYQARQDYSPSAVPQPLQSRGSFPSNTADESPATRYPDRKSSLSQQYTPDFTEDNRALAPVKETNNEHGNDSTWASHNSPTAMHGAAHPSVVSPNEHEDEIEESRRFSTSPQLPDLNRMSKFDMSFLGHSLSDSTDFTATSSQSQSKLAPVKEMPSPIQESPSLRTQPSLGFKSVVHQAFDDQNVPETQSEGGVTRANSESTDTSIISPIMSRGPLGSTSDRIAPLARVEEREPTDAPSAFQPGHRRNISTPSPGNSPARTPNLTSTAQAPVAEHVDVLNESDQLTSPVSQFLKAGTLPNSTTRPHIPGGWTSYATSEAGSTTGADSKGITQNESSRPALSTYDDSEENVNDVDVTPTKTRQSQPLPQVVYGAGPGAVSTVAPPHLGHDESSVSAHQYAAERTGNLKLETVALPTPDPALAPIKNPYISPVVDPRLKASSKAVEPGQASKNPAPLGGSADPALKGPPDVRIAQNSIASQPRSSNAAAETVRGLGESSNAPNQAALTPLRVDSFPDDAENERLHNEIVQSLSPDPGQNDTTQRFATLDDGASVHAGTRESTYLPSEYDNYWAATSDDAEPMPTSTPYNPSGAVYNTTLVSAPVETNVPVEETTPVGSAPSIPPLSVKRSEQPAVVPGPLQHRFSWEGGPEQVNTPTEAPPTAESQTVSAFRDEQPSEPTLHSKSSADPETLSAPQGPTTAAQTELNQLDPQDVNMASNVGRDTAIAAGGVASVATAAYVAAQPSLITTTPATIKMVEDTTPSAHRSSTDTASVLPAPLAAAEPPAHGQQPSQQRVSDLSKITNFRDILAFQSSEQRVRAYNDSREQFAIMDTGISEWLQEMAGQHRDLQVSAPDVDQGVLRSKTAKTPGSVAPVQQPYYQQYLNASSPTSSPTSSRPPTGLPSGTQQGPSSGGGNKAQQVQAKSKELLHSAGIFGGKASKAGKGFLAFGKNKLRGSGGGGDKVD